MRSMIPSTLSRRSTVSSGLYSSESDMVLSPVASRLFAEFENFKNYPTTSRRPTLSQMTDEDNAAIGRLIRAFAEFEDCAFLFT